MDRPRLEDFMRMTSFEAVVKAIENNEEQLKTAETLLENLLERFDAENKIEMMDLLYMTSLAYYSKGVEQGMKFSKAILD